MNVTREISNAFNAQATRYEQAAKVQTEIGERLFERLHYLNIQPRYILDLGCGPGIFLNPLQIVYPDALVVGFDLAYLMLKQAKIRLDRPQETLVNGNMLTLPFASGVFDLVFANQAIHWAHPFHGVLRELNRVMNPKGCLMFSTLGPDTMIELKQAFSDVDHYAHANRFMDMHNVGDQLLTEKFLDPVMDVEYLTVHYSKLSDLLQALKAQGVRNINSARPPGLMGKHSWTAFEANMMQTCTAQGKFPLTYEVVYGHAWKGEQQRVEHGIETRIPVSQLRRTSVV